MLQLFNLFLKKVLALFLVVVGAGMVLRHTMHIAENIITFTFGAQ